MATGVCFGRNSGFLAFICGITLGVLLSLIHNSTLIFDASNKFLSASDAKPESERISLRHVHMRHAPDISLPVAAAATAKHVDDQPTLSNSCYGSNGPRILCVVFTYSKNYATKAVAVNNTWGKRCDKLVFMGGARNLTEFVPPKLPVVHLNVPNNYSRLTEKTIETMLHAYDHLVDDFDWLLKADDDTYVIVENLRRFLATKCERRTSASYGFVYKPSGPERFQFAFNSGGAGYALSNEVVRSFAEKYRHDAAFCRNTTGAEDADLAWCMRQLGVTPGNSRDELGRERFHPLSLGNMWSIREDEWTYKYAKYPVKKKEESASDTSISFHYTSEAEMYQLDFLIYKLNRHS